MAIDNIPIEISENTQEVVLDIDDTSHPYYVGARAYVTQIAEGAIVTVIDKFGRTEATLLDGNYGNITDISYDPDTKTLKKVNGVVIDDVVTLSDVAISNDYEDLDNAPNLAPVATSGNYGDLTNKPIIPIVNNGTLSIKRNNSTVGTFSANSPLNETVNIEVPTTAADVGAVPTTRTINGKSLSNNIELTASDVNAPTRSELSTLNDRMDSFTHLAEGSTTGDAELIDARTAGNGVTYPNAGDAIRGQYKEVADSLYYPTDINDRQQIFLYKGYFDGNHIASADTTRILYVRCKPNHRYYVWRSSIKGGRFRIASTSSTSIVNNTSIEQIVNADSLQGTTYITPADAYYLLIFFWRTADAYGIEELATEIYIMEADYADVEYRETKNSNKWSDAIEEGLYKSYQTVAKRLFLYDGNVWTDTNVKDALHICCPVNEGDKITVFCGEVSNHICFMANATAINGLTKNIIGERTLIDANCSATFTVPTGANYMYFHVLLAGVFRLPVRIDVNGHDIIKRPQASDSYETVFFDDFNDDSLSDKWKLVEASPTSLNAYISLFKDVEDLAYVDSGCLVLKSRLMRPDESYDLGYTRDGFERTMICGNVSTQDSFAFRKGKVSARIRTSEPFGSGHPWCFWLFGQNSKWANAVEYDIIEDGFDIIHEAITVDGVTYPAGSVQHVLWTNTHYDSNPDENSPYYYKIGYAGLTAPATWGEFSEAYDRGFDPTEWHVYSVEFDEDNIVYKVDDIFTNAISIDSLQYENETDWMCPKDIRFNIKTSPNGDTNDAFLFVDWVKAEAEVKKPLTKIEVEDLSLNIGDSHFVHPTFAPSDATNLAFNMVSSDESVVRCYNYLENSMAVYHRLDAIASGSAVITITSANGDITTSFNVVVA